MKLYDEEELRIKNEKSKRIKNLILVGIIFSVLLIVLLMGGIYYLVNNPNKITIIFNGKESEKIENMIITKQDNEGGTMIYFPIRQIANEFGYSSNNGDSEENFENTENCYIDSEDEIAIFTENSNVIYKKYKAAQENGANSDYEEIIIDNFVIKENNILYIDIDGLAKAFNLNIKTNAKMKRISITPLDAFIASAEKLIAEKKIGKLSAKFVNQKALLDDMVVIESESGEKGVVRFSNGEEILGYQYDDITYIPQQEKFLIKKDDKVGIIGSDRIVRIKPQYDKLTLIDNTNGLYLTENGPFCGVIDENGNIKIHPEFSKIGVSVNEYGENGLKNGYVLLGSLIPAQKDGRWFFYKIESLKGEDGVKSIECSAIGLSFEDIGCRKSNSTGTTSNLMVIEDYNVVVVKNNDRYGLLTGEGKPASGLIYLDAFIEKSEGKKDYYMTDSNGNKIKIIDLLEAQGITKVK